MSAVAYHYGAFPPSELQWRRLVPLLGPANAAIAKFDGLLQAIPNPHVLLTPLTAQEAVLSSRIEGTQATLVEVLEYEAGARNVSESKRDDIQEIINYRKAMVRALELLQELPLCLRIVKEAHRVLLDGVRGRNKMPGEFRVTPNWNGPPGCEIEDAKFVPISADKLPEGMSTWERFIHAEHDDRLIQLALLHAEFEALHPFLDGNGRLGRMLVPLFLHVVGLLPQPVFYLSAYLERNRDIYYEKLLAVSHDNDWTGWSEFFLKAVIEQAQENQDKAHQILKLYQETQRTVTDLTHSQHTLAAVDILFRVPIFNTSDFVKHSDVPEPTARAMLKTLKDSNVLRTVLPGSGRRPATLAFSALLNVAEGYEAF